MIAMVSFRGWGLSGVNKKAKKAESGVWCRFCGGFVEVLWLFLGGGCKVLEGRKVKYLIFGSNCYGIFS